MVVLPIWGENWGGFSGDALIWGFPQLVVPVGGLDLGLSGWLCRDYGSWQGGGKRDFEGFLKFLDVSGA